MANSPRTGADDDWHREAGGPVPLVRDGRGTRPLLTMAMSEYDHVRALTAGEIRVDGIELNTLNLSIEEIFFRFTRFREWDVSEMSMGKYVSLISQGDRSLTAIPVFPSRAFRHSSIYVRRSGAVVAPRDLAGRRVGIPEWAQTAAIYSRGLLMHDYGIPLESIAWVQAGVNQPGRVEKVALRLPPGIRVTVRPETTLNDMLLGGEIDALLSAHPPEAFKAGDPAIVRLFEDYRAVEEAYWRDTGIFPIMHTVAIRSDIVAQFPWVAMNLYKAFERAKRASVARALEITASRFPLPWVADRAAHAQALFGDDIWPYGIEANRATLDAFLRFAHEQGVCHRRVEIEELFPAQLGTSFKV